MSFLSKLGGLFRAKPPVTAIEFPFQVEIPPKQLTAVYAAMDNMTALKQKFMQYMAESEIIRHNLMHDMLDGEKAVTEAVREARVKAGISDEPGCPEYLLDLPGDRAAAAMLTKLPPTSKAG